MLNNNQSIIRCVHCHSQECYSHTVIDEMFPCHSQECYRVILSQICSLPFIGMLQSHTVINVFIAIHRNATESYCHRCVHCHSQECYRVILSQMCSLPFIGMLQSHTVIDEMLIYSDGHSQECYRVILSQMRC